MNENIKKIMIPLGVAWVGVSLVLGLVIVLLPLSKRVKVVESGIVYAGPGQPIEQGNQTLGTKVKIKDTQDPNEPGDMTTKVKILNNKL